MQSPLAGEPRRYSPWYLRHVLLIAFLVVCVSLMDRYSLVIITMTLIPAGRALCISSRHLCSDYPDHGKAGAD
jgi:hypothetical protein